MIHASLLSAFRSAIVSGGYNLLLGSGVTLDSKNGQGELLRGGQALREDLCRLTSVRPETSLTRVYGLLNSEQRDALRRSYSNCVPGASLLNTSHFLWRRIFTFNIDDAIEAHYESSRGKKQSALPMNYDDRLEPTPNRLSVQTVHLHGWVRSPSDFVFSTAEYARVMSSMNPWMHLLAEILATESFIIAGTSLNEVDLEYYLSHRTSNTPRRGTAPSLLIEPRPDAATEADCVRHGLVLVRTTFQDFMGWLRDVVPTPPTIAELLVPDTTALFSPMPGPLQLVKFFTDFEMVAPGDQPLPSTPSPFMYGRKPAWQDLNQHVDIARHDTEHLADLVENSLGIQSPETPRLFVVLDEAGTGKSTIIRRVAHTLATLGKPALMVRALSKIDISVALESLACTTGPVLVVVDGLADHVEQVRDLIHDERVRGRIIVLAAERAYRAEFIELVLSDTKFEEMSLTGLTGNECEQLVERYRRYGLIGEPKAIQAPRSFAKRLVGDPVAIAVCRILNDFRPLEEIIDSLWTAADPGDKLPYLTVALAQHCYSAGLRYSLLQSVVGARQSVANLFGEQAPLGLTTNVLDDEYVVCYSVVIGERVLQRVAQQNSEMLVEAFRGLAMGLAPHVSLPTLRRRTPEARLASRLFDVDKIVRPMLGAKAEDFYTSVQGKWEWNSRYWEQRALLVWESDLSTALQHARHAVSIEPHSHPLTTLGKILMRTMESVAPNRRSSFEEAFAVLERSIAIEARFTRRTVHPFATLLSGAARYIELGGKLTMEQRTKLLDYCEESAEAFPRDPTINATIRRLEHIMA